MIAFLQVVAGCAILILFCMLLAAARKWPAVLLVILGAITLIAWEIPTMGAIASPGGYSIYLLDVMSLALVAVGLFNWKQLRPGTRPDLWLWLILAVLLTNSIVRGILTFGVNTPVTEARGFLILIAATFWTMSLDMSIPRFANTLRIYIVAMGWALTAAGIYHAARYGVGGVSDFVDASGIEQTGRILVSGQAMVVGLCAIFCLHVWIHLKKRAYLWSGVLFLAIVLISQHRSVWIAIATAGLAYVVLVGRKQRSATLFLGIVTSWVILVTLAAGFADGLISQLQDSSANISTYDARTASWDYLIGKAIAEGYETSLFGAPFGSGFDRIEPNGIFVTFQPHNIYVSIFLRLGIVGLSIYAIALLLNFLRILRSGDVFGFSALAGICVYGWAYGPTWYFFIFLAFALSGAALSVLPNSPPQYATYVKSAKRTLV